MENLLFLGVPILKHIRVVFFREIEKVFSPGKYSFQMRKYVIPFECYNAPWHTKIGTNDVT